MEKTKNTPKGGKRTLKVLERHINGLDSEESVSFTLGYCINRMSSQRHHFEDKVSWSSQEILAKELRRWGWAAPDIKTY